MANRPPSPNLSPVIPIIPCPLSDFFRADRWGPDAEMRPSQPTHTAPPLCTLWYSRPGSAAAAARDGPLLLREGELEKDCSPIGGPTKLKKELREVEEARALSPRL